MACTLRKVHIPAVPASDHHHVVPQAWQQFWLPESFMTKEEVDAYRAKQRELPLWEKLTVEVCPNCHRRIHEAIVAMMRSGHDYSEDPLDAKKAAFGNRRLNAEQTVAYRALTRFCEAGGSLVALRANQLFGQQ